MSRRRRLLLGQTAEAVTSWEAAAAMIPAGIFGLQYTPGPVGTLLSNAIANANTGNLTQDQVNSLKAQATQSLIQTGLDPNTAASQASQVVDQSLASVTAPGAFGITWTGAGPNAPTWLDAGIQQTSIPVISWCSTDSLGLGLTNCVYALIGGGAVLLWWLLHRR